MFSDTCSRLPLRPRLARRLAISSRAHRPFAQNECRRSAPLSASSRPSPPRHSIRRAQQPGGWKPAQRTVAHVLFTCSTGRLCQSGNLQCVRTRAHEGHCCSFDDTHACNFLATCRFGGLGQSSDAPLVFTSAGSADSGELQLAEAVASLVAVPAVHTIVADASRDGPCCYGAEPDSSLAGVLVPIERWACYLGAGVGTPFLCHTRSCSKATR